MTSFIFISGRGTAISSAKQGKSGSIYNLVTNKKVVLAAQTCVFHENPNCIQTELPKAHITKCMFLSSTKIFEASKTNSVDPDQTAPVGAV